MKYIILFGVTTAIFFLIDMIWLGAVAKNFYREKLAFVFTGEVNWAAAFIFYFIYIVGILYFVVIPGTIHHDWQKVLLSGAFLGLLCYATYDLTNMATIKQWPLSVVIVDILWGTVLTGTVSLLAWKAATAWLGW
jgi:uncharacterized membrane protein